MVTIVIPGWILFTQNDTGPVAASLKNTPLPAHVVATPTQIPIAHANPASSFCVTPTPFPRLARNARLQDAPGEQRLSHASLSPTATVLQQRSNALSQSHLVYSGRPGGSMTHLQLSPSAKGSPTVQATRGGLLKPTAVSSLPSENGTSAALLPHLRLRKASQNLNPLLASLPGSRNLAEIAATPIFASSSSVANRLQQIIVDKCVSSFQFQSSTGYFQSSTGYRKCCKVH